jgi:hypothetical protein
MIFPQQVYSFQKRSPDVISVSYQRMIRMNFTQILSYSYSIANRQGADNYTRQYTTGVVFKIYCLDYYTGMDNMRRYLSEFDCSAVYEITVHGKLATDTFGLEEMTLACQTLEDGSIVTTLTGLLTDQAALSGILNIIQELKIPLVSLVKVGDCL